MAPSPLAALPSVPPKTVSMGSPGLTVQECCEKWGVSSRNSVKAMAAAHGVELPPQIQHPNGLAP